MTKIFNEYKICFRAMRRYFRRGKESIPTSPLPPYTSANTVKLLTGGDEILHTLLNAIDSAEETIRWNVLLFRPDNAGTQIAEALVKAGQRGVTVQLAFDFVYTTGSTFTAQLSPDQRGHLRLGLQKMVELLMNSGAKVHNNRNKLYPSQNTVDKESQKLYDELMRNICIRWDHFDHRKVLVIDEKTVILGGANVGDEYLYLIPPDLRRDMREEATERQQYGLPEAWDKWVDAAAHITGAVAAVFAHEFDVHWSLMHDEHLQVKGESYASAATTGRTPVQPLHQHPGTGEISTAYAQMIDNARHSIYIASPYISFPPIIEKLIAARKRGVQVVMVYPNKHNDIQLSAKLFQRHIPKLLQCGIEVYENNLRMAHYKLMVVDERHCMIGSFNLNYRSFKHDFELNAAVDSEALAQDMLTRVFEPALQMAEKVTEAKKPPRTLMQWVLEPFS